MSDATHRRELKDMQTLLAQLTERDELQDVADICQIEIMSIEGIES